MSVAKRRNLLLRKAAKKQLPRAKKEALGMPTFCTSLNGKVSDALDESMLAAHRTARANTERIAWRSRRG